MGYIITGLIACHLVIVFYDFCYFDMSRICFMCMFAIFLTIYTYSQIKERFHDTHYIYLTLPCISAWNNGLDVNLYKI